MIGVILAAALVAVAPASDSIELTLSVAGSSEVPAQAFQVSAMVMPRPGPGVADSQPDPFADVKALETEERKICSVVLPMGFVGNEYFPPEEEAPGQSVETVPPEDAEAAPREEGTFWTAYGISRPYTGLFATRDEADRALSLLKARKPTMLSATPVLYDCDEALELAKVDALKRSQAQAQAMAEAMGMTVAGVVRIDEDQDNQAVIESLARLYGGAADEGARTVSTTAGLRVTFKLVK